MNLLTHKIRWVNTFSALLLVGYCFLSGCFLMPHKSEYPPLETITPELFVGRVWMAQTGGGAGDSHLPFRPFIFDDQIIMGSATGVITSRNRVTGGALWEIKVDRAITSSVGVGGGKLFLGTAGAKVLAFDLETKKQVWRSKVPNQVLAMPLYSEGLVIVKTINGELIALDAQTGEQRWIYIENLPRLTLRGDSQPQISNKVLVSGFADGNLVVLTVEKGKLVWEKKVVQPSGFSDLSRMIDIDADPVIKDGIIYVVSYQGNLSAIELNSGKLLWQHPLSSLSGLAVSETTVFVTDTTGRLWSFDKETGTVNWRQTQFETRRLSGPAVIDNYVVVADDEGYIHWLAQKDGHSVSRQFFDESGVNVAPIVEDDLVYVVSRNGTIVALNPRPEVDVNQKLAPKKRSFF